MKPALPRLTPSAPWRGALALVLALAASLLAQAITSPLPPQAVTATSRSGQFIIHGRESLPPPSGGRLRPVTDDEQISLRPEVLAVTCERIRTLINQRFGAEDRAGSRVHLYLRRRHAVEGRLNIVPQAIREGWQYHLELPDNVEWSRLVRALVEVVLLDQVNRGNATDNCVQPPFWLSEGLTELLLNEFGRDLVLESQTTLNRSARRPDPLAPVRAVLAGHNPIGFSDLGLVGLEQLTDPGRFAFFRASAALLVAELLQDRAGTALLRAFLQQMPRHLNWQTAFLRASNGRFKTLLDVEKWWAVSAANVLSHDPALLWPRTRVLAELRLILSETADVRTSTNSPSARRTVALSEVVRTWEFGAQRDVLRRKVNQLQLLSMHTPRDLMPLVSQCYHTLDSYLDTRSGGGRDGDGRMDFALRARMLGKATAQKLDELDRAVAAAAGNPT
jgi:hypothetical protein